ncbi:MAG: DUF6364 family protein [Melioribacteraceae bacterium]|nr:DUF6364 family protein [Melioribacteraceae bacterium]MCF8394708.1 DUF6364 family protein [Melioribacteraceae bacterium]MCF8418093.1 DUF6364 family protein [Melioribacteraceae bacterium]
MTKNITLSMDSNLIKRARDYAKKRGKSLNSLIRELLNKELTEVTDKKINEMFLLMDKSNADSKGKKWSRDELYD